MGYVSLVANSIVPSIIIHFMNNFLSNYFFYGAHLNWPIAKFANFVLNVFSNNIFAFILSSTLGILSLIFIYKYLTKQLLKERTKNDVKKIVIALKMDKLSIIQAQIQFKEINNLLYQKKIQEQENKKTTFLRPQHNLSKKSLYTLKKML